MIEFRLFNEWHWLGLALTAAVSVAVCVLGRSSERARRLTGWALAGWLALATVVIFLDLVWRERIRVWDALPLHLCDCMVVIAVVALLTQRQLMFELTYFWGLAGATQAMLTPDIGGQIAWERYAYFFGAHGGTIAAAFFLIFAWGLRPQKGSVWRAFAGLAVYAAVVGAVDWLVGANYGYLRQKPGQSSLVDYLGPWPWYILSMGAIGLMGFSLLYAPFFVGERLRARRRATAAL